VFSSSPKLLPAQFLKHSQHFQKNLQTLTKQPKRHAATSLYLGGFCGQNLAKKWALQKSVFKNTIF